MLIRRFPPALSAVLQRRSCLHCPVNNLSKLWRIFLSILLFFFFFLFHPEGGLRPGVSALWSRSTPTGMRIVSDLRAAPLASFLPFKAANCRGAQSERDCKMSAWKRNAQLNSSDKNVLLLIIVIIIKVITTVVVIITNITSYFETIKNI